MGIVNNVLRIGEKRSLKKIEKAVKVINYLEQDVEMLTDAELRAKTQEFKTRILEENETLESVLPEAFAVVRETAKRVIGQRPYDVQLMGGIALHLGNIAEMKTGEGKTLVATMPSYLNSLTGKGVHVVTVNDYLAERDAEWMGRIHWFLGVSVGCILTGMNTEERKEAYGSDITYGTNNEFGFDYLRDNMASSAADIVQRGHNYAIVDEVDSILIDEARTPLIISGPSNKSLQWYGTFAKIVKNMKPDEDYVVDFKKKQIAVLEPAIEKAEDSLGVDNLYVGENTQLVGHLMNAIKAKELFRKDKEYIVTSDKKIVIVDEHTGRTMAERRYSDGIHQAIEGKEGVPVLEENQTFATVTLQNYFKLYKKLSGMTGTAVSEASEFKHTYNLGVIPIPTNKESSRVDAEDVIYQTEDAKFNAVAKSIKEAHSKGQPVLVGTVSVEKSEKLSKLLKKEKVPHKVLNAKNNTHEAKIVADAGRKGAVTVSTNMAGRGTDIVLGGNPEHIATVRLEKQGIFPKVEGGQITDGEVLDGEGFLNAEEYNKLWLEEVEKAKSEVDAEHEEVTSLGGLLVIGTERHESRRIDDQLRGRSGRQGDPGETQFYVSFDDELVKKFNLNTAKVILERLNLPEDVPLRHKLADKLIESAQSQMETQNFDLRKEILKYDNVMDVQRKKVYHEREKVLTEPHVTRQVEHMTENVIEERLNTLTAGKYSEDWDLEDVISSMKDICPTQYTPDMLLDKGTETGEQDSLTVEKLKELFVEESKEILNYKEKEVGEENFSNFCKKILISTLDRAWKDHLHEMDYLRNGIGLRGFAQKDPVTEYRQEGYEMFNLMLEDVKTDTAKYVHYLNPATGKVQFQPLKPHTQGIVPHTATEGVTDNNTANTNNDDLSKFGLKAPAPSTMQAFKPATFKPFTVEKLDNFDSEIEQNMTRTSTQNTTSATTETHNVSAEKTNVQVERKTITTTKAEPARTPEKSKILRTEKLNSGTVTYKTQENDDNVPEQFRGIAKNAQCPCGSGKKFKRCHLLTLEKEKLV